MVFNDRVYVGLLNATTMRSSPSTGTRAGQCPATPPRRSSRHAVVQHAAEEDRQKIALRPTGRHARSQRVGRDHPVNSVEPPRNEIQHHRHRLRGSRGAPRTPPVTSPPQVARPPRAPWIGVRPLPSRAEVGRHPTCRSPWKGALGQRPRRRSACAAAAPENPGARIRSITLRNSSAIPGPPSQRSGTLLDGPSCEFGQSITVSGGSRVRFVRLRDSREGQRFRIHVRGASPSGQFPQLGSSQPAGPTNA